MHQEFERRFAEQHGIIYAEGTTFSGSQVFASLQEIETLARQIGENSLERARALALMSELQRRRQEWEDAVALGKQSLAIQKVSGDLPARDLFDVHHGIAIAAERMGDFDAAATHYRAAARLMTAQSRLTESQRLGVRQSLGHALHETGAYEEARSGNLSLLEDAERVFGATDPRLTGVLNNLAQNEYELGNLPVAENYLQRRLGLARDSKKLAIELDTLFQLGVLAFERGNEQKARRLVSELLDVARSRGDSFDVKAAEKNIAELDRRIAAASHK
jgi:tetratricopeptide (TPR) repeat protein